MWDDSDRGDYFRPVTWVSTDELFPATKCPQYVSNETVAQA